MSKTLLIGPAGSGKTEQVLDDFEKTLRETKDPLAEDFFLVLPSAEHKERVLSLLVQRGISGFFHPRVTTLDYLIASLCGVGQAGIASNVTRFLLLKEILARHAWDLFGKSGPARGLVECLLGFIDELKESMISAPDFRERMNRLKQLEQDLALKYEMLASAYEEYEEALAALGLRDRQDALKVHRQKTARPGPGRAALRKIWVDGFFDFSPLQLEYLKELSQRAEEMTVTLTKDPGPGREPLFEGIEATEAALFEMGFQRKGVSGSSRWPQAPALIHAEKNIFAANLPAKKIPCGEALTVLSAVGLEGEVEMICRRIQDLYQTGDYRFSDFAVLLRQVGAYESVLRTVFRRFKIPVEIHERERLKFSPLIECVVLLLRIFTDGWRREEIIAWLKSSYVKELAGAPKNAALVHELEKWALTNGVYEGREAWMKSPFGDFLKPLADLEATLREARSPARLSGLVVEALGKFGIAEESPVISEFTRRDGAGLTRLHALFGEVERTYTSQETPAFDSWAQRLFHLVELDLYSLHRREKNSVQVYDVSLARQKEYRVVFIAGLVERGFPVQIRENPLLSDWERDLFNGKTEGPSLRKFLPRQSLERYLFYLALTRAREKVFLSYPCFDLEGNEALPSYYLEELEALFEGGLPRRQQRLSRPFPEIREAANWNELETAVLGEIWNPAAPEKTPEPLLLYLTNSLLERGESRGRIEKSFHEISTGISDPAILATGVFSAELMSPSQIETFGQCPFRYFSSRILQLTEPQEAENVKAAGRIRHKVLEKFMREWKEQGFPPLSPDEIRGRVREKLAECWPEEPLVYEKKFRLDLERFNMERALAAFAEAEIRKLEKSPLKPEYFESRFGPMKGSRLPALVLEEGEDRVSFRGIIDRIDVDAKKEFGLVIDYKTSKNPAFNRDLALGAHLQLPLYLLAAEKLYGLKTIGAELRPVQEDSSASGFCHQEHLKASGHAVRIRSLFSAAEFGAVLKRAQDYIFRFARRIRTGVTEVKPRHCIEYCSFASVCRVEKWRLPLILEEIKKEDANEREAGKREHVVNG